MFFHNEHGNLSRIQLRYPSPGLISCLARISTICSSIRIFWSTLRRKLKLFEIMLVDFDTDSFKKPPNKHQNFKILGPFGLTLNNSPTIYAARLYSNRDTFSDINPKSKNKDTCRPDYISAFKILIDLF